jgi:hypothetical protein
MSEANVDEPVGACFGSALRARPGAPHGAEAKGCGRIPPGV